jgi:hypothetical protein
MTDISGDLFHQINRSPRITDPSTSREAAEKVAPKASKGRMKVMGALLDRALTDFEIAAAIGSIQTSSGKRRGECRDAGWVQVALDGRGEEVKRQSPNGSAALVWELTEAGRKAYAEYQRGQT